MDDDWEQEHDVVRELKLKVCMLSALSAMVCKLGKEFVSDDLARSHFLPLLNFTQPQRLDACIQVKH